MIVPATFETSIYNYIIFRVADMPAYFQFGAENVVLFENLLQLQGF
jgi:hypothetical protein